MLCLRLMIAADVANFRQMTEKGGVQEEDSSQAAAAAAVCVHVYVHTVVPPTNRTVT